MGTWIKRKHLVVHGFQVQPWIILSMCDFKWRLWSSCCIFISCDSELILESSSSLATMNPVCGSGGNFSSPLSWHTVRWSSTFNLRNSSLSNGLLSSPIQRLSRLPLYYQARCHKMRRSSTPHWPPFIRLLIG